MPSASCFISNLVELGTPTPLASYLQRLLFGPDVGHGPFSLISLPFAKEIAKVWGDRSGVYITDYYNKIYN